jgi:3-hydroxybutyryl-CoA dehydratase
MTHAVGDAIPAFTIQVSPESMKVWAKILHDPNPIHLDPAVVRAKGLGDRVINQGPTNLAYIVNALHAAFPGGTIEVLDVRFLDNVFGGETVEASGQVVEIAQTAGARRITCDVWLKAIGRSLVLSGKAVVSQPL